VILSLINLNATYGDVRADVGNGAATLAVRAMLLLALRASGVARRWVLIVDVLIGAGVVVILLLTLADAFSDQAVASYGNGGPSPFWVLLAAISPIVVIRRLLGHRRVSKGTLFGSISAFPLIAVAFYFAFLSVNAYQSTQFLGGDESTASFMYYSLETATSQQ